MEESLLQKYVLAAASQGDAGCRCNLLFWPGAAISLLFGTLWYLDKPVGADSSSRAAASE